MTERRDEPHTALEAAMEAEAEIGPHADAPPAAARAGDLERVETVLGGVLRWGVVASAALIGIGLTMWVARHPGAMTDATALPLLVPAKGGDGAFPTTPGELWTGLVRLEGLAVATLGLVVLVLTPVVRVGASVVAFAVERDRWFTLITLGVLAVLIVSFVLGKVE